MKWVIVCLVDQMSDTSQIDLSYPSRGYQRARRDREAMVAPLVFACSVQKGVSLVEGPGNRLNQGCKDGNGSIDALVLHSISRESNL